MDKMFLFLIAINVSCLQALDIKDVSNETPKKIEMLREVSKNDARSLTKDCKTICCGPTLWMGLGFICIRQLFQSAEN